MATVTPLFGAPTNTSENPEKINTSNSYRSCHQSFFRRSDRIISAHKNIQHKGRYTELTQHRFKVSGIGV
jgi:hypothetical protein